MDKLIQMQVHLDAERRKVTELQYANDELSILNDELRIELRTQHTRRYKLQDALDLTRRNYRIGIALSLALTAWVGFSNMDYAAENKRMSKQIIDLNQSDLQGRFDNVLDALHYQNNRVLELEEANKQLIKHCRPCDVKKAIKATPLPELVRGV